MRTLQSLSTVFLISLFIFPSIVVADSHARKYGIANENYVQRYPGRLNLVSSSVIVLEQGTNQILYKKNANNKKAIASITKLMTAMVVLNGKQPLNANIKISAKDVDRLRWSKSRLHVGVTLTRKELLQLALMSSENRAAFALARTYQGGINSFVVEMNKTAKRLGMKDTIFYGPTGLDARNVSTAKDLAVMVSAAYRFKEIRNMTTSVSRKVNDQSKKITFHNTNSLVRRKGWEIGLSKTGYISNSGKCLVMQVTIGHKPTIIVLLDSWGKNSRIVDAIKVKQWIERGKRFRSTQS